MIHGMYVVCCCVSGWLVIFCCRISDRVMTSVAQPTAHVSVPTTRPLQPSRDYNRIAESASNKDTAHEPKQHVCHVQKHLTAHLVPKVQVNALEEVEDSGEPNLPYWAPVVGCFQPNRLEARNY